MSAARGAGSGAARDRIVDLVFAAPPHRGGRRGLYAVAGAAAVYASIALLLQATDLTLQAWSADLAARVHAELSNVDLVELSTPRPPEPPPPPPPPEPPPPTPTAPAAERPPAAAPPAAPAQAGRIVARAAEPEGPLDLTGEAFVTGGAATYAGGHTAAEGTSTTAVREPPRAPPAPPAPPPAEDRSRPVTLDEGDWRCAWPPEADTEEIDEQTVVLRVTVSADGSVEAARLAAADPGHGFGRAALACARETRFQPALDRAGRPTRADSPPIRVHFVR